MVSMHIKELEILYLVWTDINKNPKELITPNENAQEYDKWMWS